LVTCHLIKDPVESGGVLLERMTGVQAKGLAIVRALALPAGHEFADVPVAYAGEGVERAEKLPGIGLALHLG
jgi:hypothetical protein